jgi:hypothetical protein
MKPIYGVVLLGVTLGLAACAEPSAVNMGAALSGTQEVPSNASPATGRAAITFDRESRQLTWSIDYAGLTGPLQAAHFHGPAATGANAGVQVPIAAGPSPLKGSATLTEAQATALMDGRMYVNLHTQQFPGGEIRGQVVRATTAAAQDATTRGPTPYYAPAPPPNVGVPTLQRY